MAEPHRRGRAPACGDRLASISATPNARMSWASSRRRCAAWRRRAGRSICRWSPAMCPSTTRPTGATFRPTPQIGAVGLIDDLALMTTPALPGAGPGAGARRRWGGASGAIALCAPASGARLRAAAAGRSGRGEAQRRLRAAACPRGAGALLPRRLGWRALCVRRRDGARRRRRRGSGSARRPRRRRLAVRRGPGALCRCGGERGPGTSPRRGTPESPRSRIGRSGGAALTCAGADVISLRELRAVHERWLPAFMAGDR